MGESRDCGYDLEQILGAQGAALGKVYEDAVADAVEMMDTQKDLDAERTIRWRRPAPHPALWPSKKTTEPVDPDEAPFA